METRPKSWLDNFLGSTQARIVALLRRSRQTINGLADAVGLTDNAVRNHIAALGRDGIVRDVGEIRDTGGKPARVYELTTTGEELFPKAYAVVLEELIAQIARTHGREHAIDTLRSVGQRLASSHVDHAPDANQRVQSAAEVLRSLGADLDVEQTSDGWRLKGYGCPLSAVTSHNPDACSLVTALVEGLSGSSVTECCQHGERPRCGFQIAGT